MDSIGESLSTMTPRSKHGRRAGSVRGQVEQALYGHGNETLAMEGMRDPDFMDATHAVQTLLDRNPDLDATDVILNRLRHLERRVKRFEEIHERVSRTHRALMTLAVAVDEIREELRENEGESDD